MLRRMLPPSFVSLARRLRDKWSVRTYLRHGRIPWLPGYELFKQRMIAYALQDSELLEIFRDRGPLPGGYGVGLDERCIEYPWVFSQLEDSEQRLLDAGSTLNHDYILEHLTGRRLHIFTLAPEENCYWKRGISYLFGDLRDIPIRDAFYDVAVCLSTLEHIGMDNTLYAPQIRQEQQPSNFLLAMKELNRVVRPGGRLLLSVPFGKYQDLGSLQQFDRELLDRAIEVFAPTGRVEEYFYRYTPGGWVMASAEDCADSQYVEWITASRDKWPESLPVESDLAAAARAVACISLQK